MKEWIISFGLGAGFGEDVYEIIEASSEEKASTWAWEAACQEYESYEGLHGLRSIDDIMDEDEVDSEEAEQIYHDERESQLSYDAKPYSKELHKKIKDDGYDIDDRR